MASLVFRFGANVEQNEILFARQVTRKLLRRYMRHSCFGLAAYLLFGLDVAPASRRKQVKEQESCHAMRCDSALSSERNLFSHVETSFSKSGELPRSCGLPCRDRSETNAYAKLDASHPLESCRPLH
jgi:hypothetical protein